MTTTTTTAYTTTEQLFAAVKSGELRELHTASKRGYVSRNGPCNVLPYAGRFGSGYVVLSPRWDTTKYVYVTYFVRA